MAIAREHGKKSPSQDPSGFYKSQQQGGAYGKPSRVGEKLNSGPMRETVMGRKSLGKR